MSTSNSIFYDLLTGGNLGSNLPGLFTALGIGGAGGLLTKEAYDKLGEIGVTGMTEGKALAQAGIDQSEFKPFGLTSTTGSTFGYHPKTGKVTLGLSPEEQALQSQLMGGAQSMFTSAAGPTDAREQAIYERIRAAQRPEEERQALSLEERLANQGRLGVRTSMFGGTPEQLAMAKAQSEAQNTAMLGAMQQAQREQAQQAALGQQFLGSSYAPQAQLMSALQGSSLFPQLQQRGQLYGAGLYGEGIASGLNVLLGSGLGQANMLSDIGAGLIGGLFSGK